jgi:hypothetical protein
MRAIMAERAVLFQSDFFQRYTTIPVLGKRGRGRGSEGVTCGGRGSESCRGLSSQAEQVAHEVDDSP